ncbi:MAG TPA: NAD+ synthase [Candidatus Methanoperedens sp.]|nr:NAD+ synthase [Candidatus Methanoperedens sp.]
MRIALAQINPTVGDLRGNLELIAGAAARGREAGAHLVVFPELALSGYPPEDLLLNAHFVRECRTALDEAARRCAGVDALVGFPEAAADRVHNAAALLRDGAAAGIARKTELPNYGVFDEHRYFAPGSGALAIDVGVASLLVTICEDIWVAGGAVERQARQRRHDLVLNISASPFHAGKLTERHAVAARFARAALAPVCYANLVGGQDELVFDGGSFVVDAGGAIAAAAGRFAEELLLVDFAPGPDGLLAPAPQPLPPPHDRLGEIHAALVLGTRDYLRKNRFAQAVIGLSGGIDSALTAVVAVEALGPDRVVGVSMPSRFNSRETRSDAARVAANLGIRFLEIPIQETYESYLRLLAGPFGGGDPGVAGENLQARVRGNILMALSNHFGWLVLTTGNKSETAVGYCTLYGDMAGGFAVIKDVPKTLVWELSADLNRRARREVIPESTLGRVPSAELRENQRDEDSLPPYPVLDAILAAYVEGLRSPQEIAALGFDPRTVERVIRLVDGAEYKRRQAPPGVKITPRAFGRDRRLPITNRWTDQLVRGDGQT